VGCHKIIIETTIHFERATDLARFKALQLPESGAWLQSVPSKNIGTFIDSQIFQICVGLRLGCNLYQSHVCSCGHFVDETGIYGLSCCKSKGGFNVCESFYSITSAKAFTRRIQTFLIL
jgi:hypothetical protein